MTKQCGENSFKLMNALEKATYDKVEAVYLLQHNSTKEWPPACKEFIVLLTQDRKV